MENKDKGLELLSFTLKNIKSKKSFGTNGKVFENLIKSSLEANNFNKCSFKQNDPLFVGNNLPRNKNDLKKTIEKVKEVVLNKSNIEPIPNLFKKHFDYSNIYIYIYQPFGSQQFPDFLLITRDWIIPLETKYSNKEIKNSLPKWNSNIPKKNTIYLFANHSTMTFFMGDDYISPEIRESYLEHFKNFDEKQSIEETKKKILKLKKDIVDLKNPFGLYPKIRIDYLNRKDFKISNKEEFKNDIFEYSSNNKWEENVWTFLERLNNEK